MKVWMIDKEGNGVYSLELGENEIKTPRHFESEIAARRAWDFGINEHIRYWENLKKKNAKRMNEIVQQNRKKKQWPQPGDEVWCVGSYSEEVWRDTYDGSCFYPFNNLKLYRTELGAQRALAEGISEELREIKIRHSDAWNRFSKLQKSDDLYRTEVGAQRELVNKLAEETSEAISRERKAAMRLTQLEKGETDVEARCAKLKKQKPEE